MHTLSYSFFVLANAIYGAAQLTPASLQTFPKTLLLEFPFNPSIPAYWTNYPHHRRTPLAVRLLHYRKPQYHALKPPTNTPHSSLRTNKQHT